MKKYITAITILLSFNQTANSAPKTEADFAALPRYCHARMVSRTGSEAKKWERRFGHASYIHLHHYCSGLDYRNKALVSINKKKTQALNLKAIKQFNYVNKKVTPSSFPLMSQSYYYIGEMYQQHGNSEQALKAFETSIKINKKYTKSYAAISDLYIDSGNKQEAINILKQGLMYKPKSKRLNKRLNKISN